MSLWFNFYVFSDFKAIYLVMYRLNIHVGTIIKKYIVLIFFTFSKFSADRNLYKYIIPVYKWNKTMKNERAM